MSSSLSVTSNFPYHAVYRMPSFGCPQSLSIRSSESIHTSNRFVFVVVCGLKGPRPRYPRVWKSRKRIGTISKSQKLVECIKGLSNVKEEVYGALDSFIAWELEFPLIAVKKALKTLESEKEWKRVIQVTKWMLSKGQGKTMGSYYTLLNALTEDGRLEEAEELWAKLFSENLENLPREFYTKIISIYYNREMHEKLFEVFADMEELGVKPNNSVVSMIGNVFQKLDMQDKYKKLRKKYPPVRWEYRYFKGKRVRVPAKQPVHVQLGAKAADILKEELEEDEAHEQHDAIDQPEEVEEANTHTADPLTEVDNEYNIESVGQGL